MAPSVLDQAVRNIRDTQASSRLTKTPYILRNPSKFNVVKISKFLDSLLPGPADTLTGTPGYSATGIYHNLTHPKDPGTGQVNVWGNEPLYKDFAGTLAHEDVHSLLDKSGNYTLPPAMMNTSESQKALESFNRGGRVGVPEREIPSYVSILEPHEMPGFTEQNRQQWLSDFSKTLKPETQVLLNRIIAAYQASQNSPLTK